MISEPFVMAELLKELRDLVCDAQTFCGGLGSVENLPSAVELERQVLARRLRQAEVKICHSLTQDRWSRNSESKIGKAGSETNISSPATKMSPPPSSNKTRQALPANGHCKVTTDGDGELVANGKSRSRDSLELLEEDSPPRKSSAPPPEESNNDSRTSSDAVKPLQKRLSLSVLRGWKGIRNKVSGSRRRSDAGIPRERSGTRVEKKKLPLDNIRNPEISGYLRKRDKKLGRWQRRWCLVKGDRFLYAEKDTDRHTSDAFSMKGYRVMTGEHATYKMQHVIELVHSILPSYQFAASSTEEMDKWLSVLERASGLMDDGYEIPKEFDSETLARLLYDREQAELAKDPLSPPPLPGEESVSSPEVVKSSPRLFEAIFDFEGGEDDEIPFKKGDLLLIEDGGNDHWLIGSVQTKDEVFPGIKGFVPKSYLQPVTTNSDDRH